MSHYLFELIITQCMNPDLDHEIAIINNNDDDDDDMFGDDIALDDLEDISSLVKAPRYSDISDVFCDDIPIEELGNVLNIVESSIPKPVVQIQIETKDRMVAKLILFFNI